jgi:methyl-accepting chemotaxis protein
MFGYKKKYRKIEEQTSLFIAALKDIVAQKESTNVEKIENDELKALMSKIISSNQQTKAKVKLEVLINSESVDLDDADLSSNLEKIRVEFRRKDYEIDQLKREIETRSKLVDELCIVSEVDLKGNITYVNDKHCEVSQYDRNELVGANQNIVRHPDMPKDLFKSLWSTVGAGNVFRGKITNRRKDGTAYYIDGAFAPVLGSNGKPLKYIGIRYDATDITQERIAFKSILDGIKSSFAYIEFDTNGNILEANEMFLNVMEYKEEEILQKHHKIFVNQTALTDKSYEQFWNELRAGIPQTGVFKRISKSGNIIALQATYTPVLNDAGTVMKVVKIATDVTKETETKLNSEALLRSINDTFALIEFELTGKILHANSNFLKTMGYNDEEVVGKQPSYVCRRRIFEFQWLPKFLG